MRQERHGGLRQRVARGRRQHQPPHRPRLDQWRREGGDPCLQRVRQGRLGTHRREPRTDAGAHRGHASGRRAMAHRGGLEYDARHPSGNWVAEDDRRMHHCHDAADVQRSCVRLLCGVSKPQARSERHPANKRCWAAAALPCAPFPQRQRQEAGCAQVGQSPAGAWSAAPRARQQTCRFLPSAQTRPHGQHHRRHDGVVPAGQGRVVIAGGTQLRAPRTQVRLDIRRGTPRRSPCGYDVRGQNVEVCGDHCEGSPANLEQQTA